MAPHQKHFVVLGLGTFGAALANRLTENGCRVTGLDRSPECVDALKDILYEAVIGDATERDTLAALQLKDCDGVIISLGTSLVPSLLATLHAKEQQAPHLIVKGIDNDHGRLLQYLGVDQVIFPKVDVGRQLGDRLTWPNVLDYVPIGSDYNFVEIAVPASWAGKSLTELDLRRKLGIWVIGLRHRETNDLAMFPDGDTVLTPAHALLVVGKQEELSRVPAE